MMVVMDAPGGTDPTDPTAPTAPADDREARERRWRHDIRLAATHVASGLWAGLVSGLVIGGVLGRLAMFILRLTSDPSLSGVETDDGFTIGSFTPDTIFLLLFCAVLGLIGGIFYLLVREWLPPRLRPVVMGILGATVGGAAVVRPEGIDFQELEPLSLAIAMFVVIPALYGVATSILAELLLRSAEERSRRRVILIVLPLLPVAALGPPGILILLVIFGLWSGLWLLNQYVPVGRMWRSEPVAWLGRLGLAVIAVIAGVDLVQESIEIL